MKVIVVEIAVPLERDASWTIALQRAQFELRNGIERALITKRSSSDSVICIPEPGTENFILSVKEEIRES